MQASDDARLGQIRSCAEQQQVVLARLAGLLELREDVAQVLPTVVRKLLRVLLQTLREVTTSLRHVGAEPGELGAAREDRLRGCGVRNQERTGQREAHDDAEEEWLGRLQRAARDGRRVRRARMLARARRQGVVATPTVE
jgi:hypothetical protein